MVSGAPVVARASAKVNLHLAVGAPREDGFHPLDTVYQAIGLHDDVRVVPGPGLRLSLEAAPHVDAAGVPLGEDNIVARAAALLSARTGVAVGGDVHITKAIPVAGGMAGGSADAGAALVALDAAYGLGLGRDALCEVAAELGSDVPFTLFGGSARGLGRGEIVEPLPDAGRWSWVVVPSPGEGLSTPAVYRHFDALFPDADAVPAAPTDLLAALAAGDVRRLAVALRNDLAAAAVDLRPELGVLVARGESEGALRGMVSGSGPTCVFLCDSGDAAAAVAAAMGPSALVATGPAEGARLL